MRTIQQVSQDPAIDASYVVAPNTQRADYEARGFTFVEELVGERCLLKRPSVTAPARSRPVATPPKPPLVPSSPLVKKLMGKPHKS